MIRPCRFPTWCAFSFLAALATACLPALAYNPPTDTAGPVQAQIEGPADLKQVGVPTAYRVALENRSDEAVEGTVELGLIDGWQAEPAKPAKFVLPPKGKQTTEFRVTAAQAAYSGHYPIHVWVRFTAQGKPQVAHPVLIVKTELTQAPRPVVQVPWKAFPVPASSELALWRLPAVRAVIHVFKESPRTMPDGWQGSDARTGGTFQVRRHALGGQDREVVAIHPPYKEGLIGTLAAEFPLQLPKQKPLRLVFANAVIPEGEGDGVTFRVRAVPLDAPAGELGKVLYERHTKASTWEPAEADLSALAGQSVRLQLESHPGPKNNTGWDSSFWAEPVLVAGAPPQPAPFPPKDDTGSRLLGSLPRAGGACEVRVWPGRRGLLDAVVGLRQGQRTLYFRGFETRVLGARIDDVRSPIVLQETKDEPAGEGYQVRHRFASFAGQFDLVIRLFLERGALRAKLELQNAPPAKPWQVVRLEDTALGPWSDAAEQIYAGVGNVIRQPGAFRLGFDGHQLASSFVGLDFAPGVSVVQGADLPPESFVSEPATRRYTLHVPNAVTFSVIPAENAWAGVKVWREVNGLKAAGGVPKAAGRFVFDLWGGRYQETANTLSRAFRYGMTDSMVVFHNWQRWGYDYRLPDIVPPNPQYGSLDQMQALVKVCKQAGVLFAPHDNYIDFYPDAEGFSYTDTLAFHADGQPVRAWLNEGRGAQSYRYRADRVEPYLQRNLRWIREHLGPSAYFIDVWSSAGPYDYWTSDGKYFDSVYTRKCWGEHFAWIRELLGEQAPQISESGHDQLIGWLDGAQTNHLRVGKPGPNTGYGSWCVWDIPHGDAERIPWLDAAHHDRFILHGAGYPSRYEGGLDPQLHGIDSDDYLATEVLTGHPGMVSRPFGRAVVRKYWLIQDLMRALALRTIERVEFVDGDIHRQHVEWSGGAEVWVNRGTTDWRIGQMVLPPYGFLAGVPGVSGKTAIGATIFRRGESIVEMARSPESLYVNGRQIVDGRIPIGLRAQGISVFGPAKGTLKLVWKADAPIPAGWSPFLHFCDKRGEIVFQARHDPAVFDTARQGEFEATAAFEIPPTAKPGEVFDVRGGLYHPKTGERLALSGPADRTHRLRLGQIRVLGDGDRATGMAWMAPRAETDAYLARHNAAATPIDFGPVKTAGGCRLSREREVLVVTPLPEAGSTKIEAEIRWDSLPWKLADPTHVEAVAEDGRVLRRDPVRKDAEAVRITFEPEVFCYRFLRQ